jgi:tetratricopeptide (TPR) repeat protein
VPPQGVVFQWEPIEEVLEYRITLTGPGELAGIHKSSKERWAIPDEASFAPGEQWSWQVEAVTMDGPVLSASVAFEVATHEQWKELQSLHEQLTPLLESDDPTRNDAAAYLIGSYCRSSGFYGEAIERLEDLAARHPDRKELQRELGSVYQAVGRNDKAAEAYKKALSD